MNDKWMRRKKWKTIPNAEIKMQN